MHHRPLATGIAAALLVLAPSVAAAPADTLTTVAGKVVDLSRNASGELLYCTHDRDVGTITITGTVTILADAASGPFPRALRAVATDPNGDVAVLDEIGDIYRLVGGTPPAVLVYDDLYLVQDPTDLIVDAAGNYVLAMATPTSGVRGMNWVSADGERWAYYLVRHSPVQLAADPLTGDLLLAEDELGGGLWQIDTSFGPHPTTPLDVTTRPGFTAVNDDGDLAVEADGDVLLIAGGTVWRHDRGAGTTAVLASGYGPLRGITIAASSGNVTSSSGWSAYLAEGEYPTAIREIGNVGAPAGLLAPNLGWVPGPGERRLFFNGIKVYDLAADLGGDLLVGGDLYGHSASVRRIDIPTYQMTIVADDGDGISGRVEGISVAPNGTIYALTTQGVIHAIQEYPLQVTTVFDNAQGFVTAGKDLTYGRGGKLYIADRDYWGGGEVHVVDVATGARTTLAITRETRGLCADPFHSGLLVAEWVNGGFEGEVGRLDPLTSLIDPVPGWDRLNFTNAATWADGDLAMVANGNAYCISEDDWTLSQYLEGRDGYARMGSGYLNHPSGLAIAPSSPDASNATGWSLYISEFDFLWEYRNTAAPAPVIVDSSAPPVGRHLGTLDPEDGRPRAMIADPAGGGFLITTSDARLLSMTTSSGAVSELAGPAQGLSGDLVALAATSTGRVVVAAFDGVVYELDPGTGYTATVLFANAGSELEEVRGVCVDGDDRVLIVDRPAYGTVGRLHRLDGGALELLTRTARGVRPAVDPLTGEVFVTEQGSFSEGAGEVLRVDAFVDPAAHGHFHGDGYFTFAPGARGGDLAFDDDGNFYVAVGDAGRVTRVDRAAGTRAAVAGNYTNPVGVALADGRSGTAGAEGASLFVLDEWVVWEIGIDGRPAPPPPSTPPGLAPPTDLRVHGSIVLGQPTSVTASNPGEAGKLYWILPTLSGKVPGFPLSVGGDPTDTRVVPSNRDSLWMMTFDAGTFPGFVGYLDGAGNSAAGTALMIPNDPWLLDLDAFLDLTWVVIDFSAQNKVSYVGGTAQLWFGD